MNRIELPFDKPVAGGSMSHRSYGAGLGLAAVITGFAMGLAPTFAFATYPTTPVVAGTGSCGTATVDGLSGDWNLTDDFLAAMYEAGNSNKTRLSDAYLRYDAATETAYVLVLTRNGFVAEASRSNAWVKVYDSGNSAIPFSAFNWVTSGTKTIGYEAAFHLPAGDYAKVEVHLTVKPGRTSSTGKKSGTPISLSTPECSPAVCTDGEDFEGLAKGTILSNQLAGITVTGSRKGSSATSHAMIFDTANPTGGDTDLRTPGSHPTNKTALGKVVIITEDGDTTDPDDNQRGGILTFSFANLVDLTSVKLLDIEETGGTVKALDAAGKLIASVAIPKQADNAVQSVAINATGVKSLVVTLAGSGALAEIVYCDGTPPPPTLVALGNRVWIEANGQPGYQPGADQPVSGVNLELTGPFGGPALQNATTGADGCYLFDNLSGGDYAVRIPASQTALAGYVPVTPAGSGTADDNADHNGTLQPGGEVTTGAYSVQPNLAPQGEQGAACAANSSLPDANVDLTADFAFTPILEVGLGNRVWKEVNGVPGYQRGPDPLLNDQPIGGVTVTVRNLDTNETTDALTNDAGCYLVEGLAAGSYIATILAGQGALTGLEGVAIDPDTTLAGDNETSDDSVDQNGLQLGVGGDTESNVITLTPGATPTGEVSSASCSLATLPDANVNETVDFAFKAPDPILEVGIGDRVYFELNGQPGYQSGEDRPVTSVSVEVLPQGSNTPAAIGTTDAMGCYLVEGLDAGSYAVRLPSSLFATGGPLFGYSPAVGGTDSVDQDNPLDHNARWELDGQTITGAIVTQGYDLQPGTMPTLAAGQEQDPAEADACVGETLPDSNVNRTADLAVSELVAVGNLLWEDKDGVDGFNPASDLGRDGVLVELHRTDAGGNPLLDGNGNPVEVRSMTTDGGGFYLFDDLQPGFFVLKVPASQFQSGAPLGGYISLPGNGGGTNDTDDDSGDASADENGQDSSDPTLTGIASAPFELQAGQLPENEGGQRPSSTPATTNPALFTDLQDYNTDLTRDLAVEKFVLPPASPRGSLGSTVFIDANWNGKQDTNEPGILGVEVRLYAVQNAVQVPKGVTFTNPDGEWVFLGLEEGTYQVVLPEAQMASGGVVSNAVSTYFGTRGIPTTVPVKALSTKDSAFLNDDTLRQDGDDNGLQAGYGGEIVSDTVVLTYAAEPENAVGGDTGLNVEFAQTPTSAGHTQDDGNDDSGDMTIDFGVTHQCYDICDIDRDGFVSQSDVDTILARRFKAPIPGPGMPGSGSCGGGSLVTVNDKVWCEGLSLNQNR